LTPTATKKLADRQPSKRGQFRSNLTAGTKEKKEKPSLRIFENFLLAHIWHICLCPQLHKPTAGAKAKEPNLHTFQIRANFALLFDITFFRSMEYFFNFDCLIHNNQ
jgi:hypothetical protein